MTYIHNYCIGAVRLISRCTLSTSVNTHPEPLSFFRWSWGLFLTLVKWYFLTVFKMICRQNITKFKSTHIEVDLILMVPNFTFQSFIFKGPLKFKFLFSSFSWNWNQTVNIKDSTCCIFCPCFPPNKIVEKQKSWFCLVTSVILQLCIWQSQKTKLSWEKNGFADKKTHVTGQNIQQVHLFRTGGLN